MQLYRLLLLIIKNVEGQREAQTRRLRPQAGHGALQPAHVVPLADLVPAAGQDQKLKQYLGLQACPTALGTLS